MELNMYVEVFKDIIWDYLENNEIKNITDEQVDYIARQMISKNDYLWEIIDRTIETYLEILKKGEK